MMICDQSLLELAGILIFSDVSPPGADLSELNWVFAVAVTAKVRSVHLLGEFQRFGVGSQVTVDTYIASCFVSLSVFCSSGSE